MRLKPAATAAAAVLAMLSNAGDFSHRAFASEDHDWAKRLKETGDILPLEKSVGQARAVHSGQILEAEFKTGAIGISMKWIGWARAARCAR